MVLNTHEGQQYLATAADSVFLEFPKRHELLNGFWHDMADDQFMFISEYSPSHKWVQVAALEEGGYQTLPLGESDYTLEDPQVGSIIASLGKFIVYSLEKDLREAV